MKKRIEDKINKLANVNIKINTALYPYSKFFLT